MIAAMAINPPRPRMPPLNALRAFEAAARHEGFAKAATELGVTPAAVSQQIKALEDWLGAPLFIRRARGLQLTEAARVALEGFTAAFDAIGLAVQQLRSAAPRQDVHIAALPAIAQLWLAPRLPALRVAFPLVRLSIHAIEAPPDFRREPFDLGIFLLDENAGTGTPLSPACGAMFPVCAPGIAERLGSPADLASIPLLWDTSWKEDWPRWLAAAGRGNTAADAGPAFSLYGLAVQAAIDGAGVLIGHEILVAPHLASGQLVAPFAHRASSRLNLRVLAPDRPSAVAMQIIEWLRIASR